jgi:hypothetical protein
MSRFFIPFFLILGVGMFSYVRILIWGNSMLSYVAHSDKPSAVRCVRQLRARALVMDMLGVAALALLVVVGLLPETSSLRAWLVLPATLALIGSFSAYLSLSTPRREVKHLLAKGEVRKVSSNVRSEYHRFTKTADINPCDDELFTYDVKRQVAIQAVHDNFLSLHGRKN